MAIREYRTNQIGGRITSFNTGSTPAIQAPRAADFSQIQAALSQFNQRALEKRQAEGLAAAEEQALQAQSELGVAGLAEPDQDWGQRYQDAYEAQAKTVYDKRLKTDALQQANQFLREHPDDPEQFAQKFNSYSQGVVESLEDADPAFADSVSNAMLEINTRFAQEAATAQFKREQEQNRVDALSALNEEQNLLADTLLQNPSEETRQEAMAQSYASIEDLDNANFLSPAELETARSQVNDFYAQSFVRGRANQAIENNDFEEVQFLTDQLRKGKYFDDNTKGEALASQIETDVRAAQKGQGAVRQRGVEIATERGEAFLTSVQTGREPTLEEQERFEADVEFMLLNGDAEDQQLAQELVASRAVVEEVLPDINTMGPAELDAVSNRLNSPGSVLNLDNSTRTLATQAIKARKDLLASANSKGDYAALGDPAIAKKAFGDFVGQSSQGIAFELNRSQRIASSNSGVAVQTVPPWTDEQVSQAVTYLGSAFESGRTQEYRDGLETFLAPYKASGDTFAGYRLLLNKDETLGGSALIGAALLDPSGRSAANATQLAVQGAAVTGQGQKMRPEDLNNDTRTLLRALSASNGQSYSALTGTLINIGAGLTATNPEQYPDRESQIAYVNDLVSQVSTIRMDNGQPLLAEQLGAGEQQQQAAAAVINDFLKQDYIQDLTDVDNLRPVPIGNGQFRFFDVGTGTLLRPENSNEAVTVTVGGEEYERAIEADQEVLDNQNERLKARRENALQLKSSERVSFNLVGQEIGLGEEESLALYRAISLSPATSIARMPDGIAPETLPKTVGQGRGTRIVETSDFAERADQALEQVKTQQAETPQADRGALLPRSLGSKNQSRLATLVFYSDLLGEYNGNKQKALAAVAAGKSEVEFAVDAGGEEWLDEMPEEVQVFVNRGLPNG